MDHLPPLLVHIVIECSSIQLTPYFSKDFISLCTGNKTNLLIHLPIFLITLYKLAQLRVRKLTTSIFLQVHTFRTKTCKASSKEKRKIIQRFFYERSTKSLFLFLGIFPHNKQYVLNQWIFMSHLSLVHVQNTFNHRKNPSYV